MDTRMAWNRAQFDWSNPKYRELAPRSRPRLAERFGHDANVIGWQIDNEYGNERYGAETRRSFSNGCEANIRRLKT